LTSGFSCAPVLGHSTPLRRLRTLQDAEKLARVSSIEELPIGTVTFLFTDIEGSTLLLKQLRDRYGEALADHQQLLREVFGEHGGREIDTQGDSFFVAFRRAKDTVTAAVAGQRRLAEHAWPDGVELRVRMGIHTGEPVVGGERYVGLGVHRAARICAAGHGGQVLVSQTTRELLRDDPIPDVSLRDLGEHQLKDLDEPERLFQLVAPGLQEEFPDLKIAAPAPFEGREGELAEAAADELTKSWRRPGRRPLAGATFAAAIVGVAVGVLLTQGSSSTADASVEANAIGVIDPDSSKIAAEVPVGVAPGGVAAGADAIWVSNTGGDSVSRIDPQTNDLRDTVPVGGGPAGVAVSPNAVWVANGLEGTVSRIDPQTNVVSQTITVGNGPSGVATGANAVWVTNSTDGTVTRIDPITGRRTGTLPAIVGASGVAVGFGRVWIVSPPSGRVVALDPRSGHVLKEIGVGVDPAAVAVGAGAVWVANRADGTVSKIDPRALAVTDLVRVGRGPAGIAAGRSDVWVTNAGDGTLSRFKPSRLGVVESVSLENPPRGIALSPRGVYVAVGSSGAEHRGGELTVISAEVDSVDPALAYEIASWLVLGMTNDGLVGFRQVGGVQGSQLVPDLAVSLPTPTDSGRTYTFQLRAGVRYTNGKFVRPADVQRSFERLFELGSPGASYYSAIIGADRCRKGRPCDLSRGIVTNSVAGTVSIHLTTPDGDLLTKLALPFAFVVPEGTPSRVTGARPVPATGPYRIAGYHKKTKTYRLVRNASFREWSGDAQPRGYPDSISLSGRFGFFEAARLRAVSRGAGDIALGGGPPMSKDELEDLYVRYPGQLRLSTAYATEYFFLNTRVQPFSDVRVRRAVNLAFDPEASARQDGRAYLPTCQLLPPNFPGYRRTCLYASGGVRNLDRARTLVRNAGAGGDRVIVWVPSPLKERGRYMASVLTSLGFQARVNAIPVGKNAGPYFSKVSDSRVGAQIGFSGWAADYPSSAAFLAPLLSCAAFVPASPERNTNFAGFCNHSIDAKMTRATALQAQDPPAATLLWQRIEREFLTHAPVVPTYNRRNVDFVAKRVGNYQYHPQWGVLLDQLWVK
jgi:peptide/nickel transport system substrate-binding protein